MPNHRQHRAGELFLHLLRQVLDVLLRILAQTLQIALLLLDVRRELSARRLTEHAATGLELLLRRLERLLPVLQFTALLILKRLQLFGRGFAIARLAPPRAACSRTRT